MSREVKSIAAGYLVENGKVLLIGQKKQGNWTPPGGHVEAGELPIDALVREFYEETGLEVEAIDPDFSKVNFDNQGIWSVQPRPFYIDVEDLREFPKYDHDFYLMAYFVRRKATSNAEIVIQKEELTAFKWFSLEELETLETYAQVKAIAKFAIQNYPK